MADDLTTHFCVLLFASTVWFWRNNSWTRLLPLWGGLCFRAGRVSPCYGGHSVEETPGSIPNPEAKLDCADGTALGRVWESRSPPDIFVGVGVSLRPVRVSLLPLPFFMPENGGTQSHSGCLNRSLPIALASVGRLFCRLEAGRRQRGGLSLKRFSVRAAKTAVYVLEPARWRSRGDGCRTAAPMRPWRTTSIQLVIQCYVET